jgi:hypothetical protein
MIVRIEELNISNEKQYSDLLLDTPVSLLYHSLKYRKYLKQVLTDAKDRYLLAFEDEKLVAAIPVFVKSGPFGSVVNSLPFYGSNGSVVAIENCSEETKRKLLQAFVHMCKEENAVTSTIVENPLASNGDLFYDYNPDLIDERIGQITTLPDNVADDEIEKQLLASFHVKTRNLVRKGKKSGFEVAHDGEEQTMRQLQSLHESNMSEIGGLCKPWGVFQALLENFNYDEDYRIYTARKDGQFAAGLLVFFFNNTAEYFTPVIHPQYRSQQPLSYLIYLAMLDAVSKGCKWWNWGGTWLSQKGVYHFKSRWGTKDYKYKYFVKVHSEIEDIKNQGIAKILENYRYFYVLPFSEMGAYES